MIYSKKFFLFFFKISIGVIFLPLVEKKRGMRKIVLLGYMGSGKSTIGLELAKKMNLSFYDLDQLIEENVGLPIKSIFDTKGELFFRKKENELLREFISNQNDFVLALGGGTPCYYDNYKIYQKETITSFYLKGSVKELASRLKLEKENRPLLANKTNEELEEFIAKHLFDRSFYYHQVNHVVIVDNKTIDDLVDEIAAKLA